MDAMEVFAILNKKIKMNGISEEEIKNSVAEYLTENGITSPVANVTKTENGAIIYIKDANGQTQVEIKNGDPGYTPRKGVDYFDGAQGPIGPVGPQGPVGINGTSVYITNINESTADSGNNTVTFSDGKTLNIKNGSRGSKGDTGDKGEKGDAGSKGETGEKGKDGTSCTHSWNGTILTVSSASGTSSANLKGEKGDTGSKGDKGDKGDTGANGSDATVTTVNITKALGYTPAKQTDVTELNEKIVQQRFDHTAYGLPVLKLTGDTTGMSKDVKKTLNYEYKDLTGSCTLKWQGNSSLAYEKKNYTIVFDNPFEAKEGWGEQKKYCLKANFIDHSHSRNLICARLWGQMVASRTTADARLNSLPNYGAVDGFPIVIELNGEFHGLYTFNIPKDAWMFGMGSGTKEAILCADVYGDAVGFKALADLKNDFELEYSTNDETDWVLASLNNLIQMVMDSNGSNINKIGQYLDWDSAIDYYIHTVLIEGQDNTKKNYILATYDGVKWFFSAYDMDSTFGLYWDGKAFLPIDNRPTFATRGEITSDKLMYLIWTYKRQELRNRYNQIRKNVYSENNVYMQFTNFGAEIPKPVLVEDVKLHPTIPSSSQNNVSQILNYYRMRVALADEWIKNTNGELDLPTQEVSYTNIVPLSVDTNNAIYNDKGYKDGYRLSSSGAEKEQEDSTLTGYMPFTKNDIARLTGVVFGTYGSLGSDGVTGGNGTGKSLYSYIGLYDSNKNILACLQCDNAKFVEAGINVSGWSYPTASSSDVITFDFSGYAKDIAYIRINAVGNGANMIVTKNEEITS